MRDRVFVEMKFVNRFTAAVRLAVRAWSPTCREASRMQSEAVDRPLSWPERIGLRLHLLLCRWCRRYGKHIRFLRQAVHDHPEALADATPRRLSPGARERLKRSLR